MATRRTPYANQASTTQRGYGAKHRAARTAALAAMHDGDPCARCGRAMYHGQALDLDHSEDRTTYLGMSHRACNQRAGASKGGRARAARARAQQTRGQSMPPAPWHSRQW